MQFFRIQGVNTDKNWAEENQDRRVLGQRVRRIAAAGDSFNAKLNRRSYFYVSDALEDIVTVGAICCESGGPGKLLPAFLSAVGLELKEICTEEITLNTARNMLKYSSRGDYIRDDDEVLEVFGLDQLSDSFFRGSKEFHEYIIPPAEKDEVFREAERFLARDYFLPELERIYAGRSRGRAAGHPVHYFVQTDDRDTRRGICRLLLQALCANGRLYSRRCCYLDFRPGENFSKTFFDALYRSSIGGAVIVRYTANDDTESDLASGGRETVEKICQTMRKYRRQVLTVFCLPRECTNSKELFYENLGNTSLIELKEEFVSGERAERFLEMLAKDSGVRTDKKLFAALEQDKGYLAPDLHELFDEWYDRKLKTGVYPQYKDIVSARREAAKAAPRGSAYEELMGMVGIEEAKRTILQALSYYKAQKLFVDRGMPADRPAMHMVFSGNPGTAKTTAARLFARIMQENGLLSKGRLIEVGRGDLVGKYVGWTAPAIQRIFREAKGRVLFIDEAYSLVDDRDGSFGDEAINTIVQEMENRRSDTIVIFAGYTDKMEKFLQKNPGLRSRIAFHIPFPDYGTEELCSIARLIAGKKGLKLTEDACAKLAEIFDEARTVNDFGNGRYVRNVIEKARMTQAVRLLAGDPDRVTAEDIATLRAEDIEAPVITAKAEKKPVGFRVA